MKWRAPYNAIGLTALVSGTFLVAACSTVPTVSPQIIPTTVSPAIKSISQETLKKALDAAAKELLVPGAVVLLRTPQGDFTVNWGTAMLGTNRQPNADTHFRIASNTKTMTAAIIMQLVQENLLNLEDPISKYVSNVPNGESITISQLLEMRSGLYNYTNAPEISASIDNSPSKAWSPAELLDIAFAHPSNFAPGTAFEYNNTNYALLGLVIEKVGKKPLAQAMHDRLFVPLGMRHTLLPANSVNTMPEPYSHGYLYGGAASALADKPYTPEMLAAGKAGTLLPTDYTGVNHSIAAAAGGVVSTANDLATWISALISGRVLTDTTQRRWLSSLRPEDQSTPNKQYGYGISKLQWGPNAIYFHGGETAGFNSFMGYDPTNRITLIVWTNLPVSLDNRPAANFIMQQILDKIYTVSPLS